MEELRLLGDDEKYHKFLQAVDPRLLANRQDVELYLDQMVNPVTRVRGYSFFRRLCNTRRTAWYFSPRFSPRFRSKEDVRDFLREKLGSEQRIALQLEFLEAIDNMLEFEPEGSLWMENLINCSQEFIEELVWAGKGMDTRKRAFQILRKFPDEPLHELAIKLTIKLSDGVFESFCKDIKYALLDSKLAQEHKYVIRRKLDDLAAQRGVLGVRIEKILKQAKP